MGDDRAQVSPCVLQHTAGSVDLDRVRLVGKAFHDDPRSIPAQGMVAMSILDQDPLTDLQVAQGAGVFVGPFTLGVKSRPIGNFPPLPPEEGRRWRTVRYVFLILFCIFIILIVSFYLPGVYFLNTVHQTFHFQVLYHDIS